MQASFSGRVTTERSTLCSVQARLCQRHKASSGHLLPSHGTGSPFSVPRPNQKVSVQASSDDRDENFKANTEFGYSRKDVLIISAAFIALGYALYYGLQAAGLEATSAGNYAQIVIFLIICVGYVSTYILRVANKDMTYTKQLEQYEQRVMQKRLEEMPETERERLMEEVDKERERRGTRS